MWVHKTKPPELSWNFEICSKNTSNVHTQSMTKLLISVQHVQVYFMRGARKFQKKSLSKNRKSKVALIIYFWNSKLRSWTWEIGKKIPYDINRQHCTKHITILHSSRPFKLPAPNSIRLYNSSSTIQVHIYLFQYGLSIQNK